LFRLNGNKFGELLVNFLIVATTPCLIFCKVPIKAKEAFMADQKDNNDNRGLANASKETRERVAKAGGEAPHKKRGQHGSDKNMGNRNE
jgi:hypothetical protein